MRDKWGDEVVALWCEMTAYRYDYRKGAKPDNPAEQDEGKIKWYTDKAKQLRDGLRTCRNCKWYAEFEGVCCCGMSVYRGEFVNDDHACKEFEKSKLCVR